MVITTVRSNEKNQIRILNFGKFKLKSNKYIEYRRFEYYSILEKKKFIQ